MRLPMKWVAKGWKHTCSQPSAVSTTLPVVEHAAVSLSDAAATWCVWRVWRVCVCVTVCV